MKDRYKQKPLVSVIVPICNVERYIRGCLDSIINQTLKEIEIICVEDHSKDESAKILREYADKDNRIVTVFHETNLSTSQARKDGVAISNGKYIMFVDGDDQLCPNACEIAVKAIEKYGTDMVQFDTEIINCAGVPEERIQMNQKLLLPYMKKIEDANLVFSCWEEKKFGFTLWNKIFDGDLCRKAFWEVEDGFFPKAQDVYAFFLIAYHCRSYMGIEDKLYKYMFGVGVTGSNYITIEKFDILLTEKKMWECLVRFIDKKQERTKYQEILDGIYKHFLSDCVGRWEKNIHIEDASEAFEHLADVWGLEAVISDLAERNWNQSVEVAEKMVDTDYFRTDRTEKDKIKTIGLYYRSIKNGGAQRVVAMLANEWAKMCDIDGNPLYKVVLITDEEDGKDDIPEYEMDSSVIRAYIPPYDKAVRGDYGRRYRGWRDVVETYKIDLVITGMWVAPCTLWDILSVKGQPSKPGFVLHAHSFTCIPFSFVSDKFAELMYDYQICDGVVVLSEVDEKYVGCFNSHVKFIANPVTFSSKSITKTYEESHNLIWIGRMSQEKHPVDAVYAMQYIVKDFPDAHLYMVGDGDPAIVEEVKEQIERLGLQKNVLLEGFSSDVEKYYRNAQVMLSTSEYEGFPMVFCESLSHGIPIVTYDMPWLRFIRDGRGILTVKQKRTDLLAQSVIDLLKDSKKCQLLGEAGKQYVGELEKKDIGQEWKSFFDSLYSEKEIDEDSVENVIFRYITTYAYQGKKKKVANLNEQVVRLKKQKKKGIKSAQKKIKRSITFRVGKAVLYIPRKLKCLLKRILK